MKARVCLAVVAFFTVTFLSPLLSSSPLPLIFAFQLPSLGFLSSFLTFFSLLLQL
jgi:hypothetical protein